MLVVGPIYLAVSAASPFSNCTILSLTTDFYALYLMVPLFKRHFHLSWHGFSTESVYMRGTKSQSHSQCVYKTSHIFIGLSGGRGWKGCPMGSHPPPLGKVTSWSSSLGFPFSHWIPQAVSGGSLRGAFSSPKVTSQWRSSMSCHSLATTRSPRFACYWHGILLPQRWSLGDYLVPPPYLGLGVGCLMVPNPTLSYRPSHR